MAKTVRVIRDPGDVKKDYTLQQWVAVHLCQKGELLYDQTNNCYCTKNKNDPMIGKSLEI